MDFTNQTVLITGSTSGIGRATAERFAAHGANVIVSGRNQTRGEQVIADIQQHGGHARFITADLTDATSTVALADHAGDVDILINNAGGATFTTTAEMTVEQARAAFELNVVAPFLLVGKLLPAMAARGHGTVVNVTAQAAGHGTSFLAAYGAAKAGLESLTRTWAVEYGPAGIRVNAVSPGAVRTPPAAVLGDMFDQMAGNTPLGRAADPAEIAAVITYLASEDSTYITGAVLPADAGMNAA